MRKSAQLVGLSHVCVSGWTVHIMQSNCSSLTFRGLCIVIYSYNKINEMHLFLKFSFGIELYMFRTGFPSITQAKPNQPNPT
jgi:hypothetical protein